MSTKSSPPWRNRIVGQGTEPPENLLANPQNWRVHPAFQQAAVMATLDEIGWIQQVVVNQVTGHVIDGQVDDRPLIVDRRHAAGNNQQDNR